MHSYNGGLHRLLYVASLFLFQFHGHSKFDIFLCILVNFVVWQHWVLESIEIQFFSGIPT